MIVASNIYVRYVLASAAALALDMAAYLLLLKAGVAPVASSVAGDGAGVVMHWLLSTRFVFLRSAAMKGPYRLEAKVLFVLTAILGLAVTAVTVALSVSQGATPVAAKVVAIAVSFNVTYLARRFVVFSA